MSGSGPASDQDTTARPIRRDQQTNGGPAQLGVDPIDDPERRPPGSKVDEGVIVKGGQQFVRHRGQQGGGGSPRGETGVHPALHGHDQYRTLEVGPAVDGSEFGHDISVLIMDTGGKVASLRADPGNGVGIALLKSKPSSPMAPAAYREYTPSRMHASLQ